MRLRPDCLVCLFNQALRVTKVLKCDEGCAKEVLDRSALEIANFDFSLTPPEAAAILYPKISQLLHKEDLYKEVKIESTQKAKALLTFAKEQIRNSSDPLDAALRASVVGNVIDFATQYAFDLEEEIKKRFHIPFAIDHKRIFLQKLKKASSLVVLGDNAGEHLFDKIMIEIFKEHFGNLKIYYFVRGRPIINDVTIDEALKAGLDTVCEVVDSGVDTPGFCMERASDEAKEIFKNVDLILSKGMGNFECLDNVQDLRLFFLFKIKCDVVANRVGKSVGDLVCIQGNAI
ncbi:MULTISPECIES: DUF89 domain-containing protein [unclassified Nitratiruptor]|uniref:damage-control phosphatase ARMT1 family protein n=1 Tax=unclassified Nitratiruptor TaxID=2624044 RepID=UPI00191546D0|nr:MULTISPECIES: ARMT1-like domain-containing protein [unclassified Nitratiruptor]BCD60816.1 hypothetical protein NitYY0810_C1594 [Nitratiruptor sp. YY08-10]BCD64748.1 hypothetical protein NitYY0814_C1602 [Nitratiruptor sp. YY08-14]